MTPLLLGIDIGTSGMKLGIVTAEGLLLASATSPHTVSHPHPSWAEMDANVWMDGIGAALRLEE